MRAALVGRRCPEGVWCDVYLNQDEPWAYMGFSGGPELYLVTGEMSDEKILQLTDPGAGDEPVSLVAGGQEASFPRNELVGRDKAIDVALRFLESQDYDPALPWEIQD